MMQEYVNPHCNILIIVSSILKVMVSIINRTEENQTVEIEIKSHKIMLADCIEIVL